MEHLKEGLRRIQEKNLLVGWSPFQKGPRTKRLWGD